MSLRKMIFLRFLVFILLNFMLTPALFANTGPVEFNQPVQVTTNPGDDFAPSVAPDGSFLIYVSDRSGNLDLWKKDLGKGILPLDRRLTSHTSEDNSPAISPDGKRVVFISHRRDTKGDVYMLDLSGEVKGEEEDKAVRLTNGDFADNDPAWSADQKFVYYTSIDESSGELRIFRVDVKSQKREAVTNIIGLNPNMSSDGLHMAFISRGKTSGIWAMDLKTKNLIQLTDGKNIEASPRWSSDNKKVFFARYQDDTDKDGKITINDRPNLWSVEFIGSKAGKYRQLTDSSSYDLLPIQSGNNLLFTSNTKGGSDVWEIKDEGMMPRQGKYGNALQIVEDNCSNLQKYPYRCLMADRNMLNDYDGEETLSRIRYRLAKGYRGMGHAIAARDSYLDLIKKHPEDKIYRGLAEIDLLMIDVEKSRVEGSTVYKARNKKALGELEKIIKNYKGNSRVASRGFLEIGNTWFELEEQNAALANYKKIIKNYPAQRTIAAEAAFSQSKVYATLGDKDRVIQTYVDVVRDFYDVEFWTLKAIGEILAIYEKTPDLNKKVSNLQSLVTKYKTLPILAAAIQNRVGELYRGANENLLAKEAYKRTVDGFAEAPRERDAAIFALADIYAEEENYAVSLSLYEKVSEDSKSLEESRRISREGHIRKTLEKGEWELRVGETKLALKTFLKLIDEYPETVEAHRGYLQAAAALKKIDPAIQFYEKRLKSKEALTVDRYALGLAQTYLDPPDLEESRENIERALGENSQVVYYHQTLGWVFEQLENKKPRQTFLERALLEYEMALVLNDEEAIPQNEANLLLNMGNGHYLLKNSTEAYYYYNLRLESGRDFVNADREGIFYQRFGEVAFKTGRSAKAIIYFKKAIKLVEKKGGNPKRLAELNDRIALAYQDSGKNKEAVDYFAKTLKLHEETGNTVSLSKALRNIANNLYMMSEETKADSAASLNEALGKYFNAIEKLEKFGVAKKEKKKSDAMLAVDIETSLSENGSTAATGFDKTGEEKLIFHYVGKIFGDFGDFSRAAEYFEKKLALMPKKLDPEKDIQVMLEKALLLNQLGNYNYLSGKYDESTGFFQESYALSKQLKNKRGIAVNAANIGRTLLLKSRVKPINELKGEMTSSLTQLEDASKLITTEGAADPNVEYQVYLKNYQGVFYHFLAFHFPKNEQATKKSSKNDKAILQAAMGGLAEDFGWAKKSVLRFDEAMTLVETLENPTRDEMKSALRQNLDLANDLTWPKKASLQTDGGEANSQVLFSGWQFMYLKAMMADGNERLKLLKEADRLLTRLPYGYSRGSGSLPMQEDLYEALTWLSFKNKHLRDALYYSEKGHQQNLITLRQERTLKFENTDQQNAYEELLTYGKRLEALSPDDKADAKEVSSLLGEYQEAIKNLKSTDPRMAGLFYPALPKIENMKHLTPPGRVLVKFQKIDNHILLWTLDTTGLHGEIIEENDELLELIPRLARYGAVAKPNELALLSEILLLSLHQALTNANSLVLLASGEMEFLPWAAMRFGDKALINKMPVTYQSSLHQFYESGQNKNLYNSRIIMVESEPEAFKSIAEKFVSSSNLSGETSTVKQFRNDFKNYGVVNVDSRTFMGGLDSSRSYVSLTKRANHFERMRLEDLFQNSVESNFIALTDVGFDLQPDSGMSPTAPLLQGLTYMGYPGILLNTGPVNKKIHHDLLNLFYGSFRKGNPEESLRQAQIKIQKTNPGSLAWANYKFYGFAGMNPQEKAKFALAKYEENAESGRVAASNGEILTSVSYLEKAMILLDFFPDQEDIEIIRNRKILYKDLAAGSYILKDYDKAADYGTKAVETILMEGETAGEDVDVEELAENRSRLGLYYFKAENYAPAVDIFKKLAVFYGDEEYEGYFNQQLASTHDDLGALQEKALNYDKALDSFTASVKVTGSEETGLEFHKGTTLRRIGNIYLNRLNQYDQAEKYYAEANQVFLILEYAQNEVDELLKQGLTSDKAGKNEEAQEFYGQAAALAEEKILKSSLAKALLYQGAAQWRNGSHQESVELLEQALMTAQEIKNPQPQTFVLHTLNFITKALEESKTLAEVVSPDLVDGIGLILDEGQNLAGIRLKKPSEKEFQNWLSRYGKSSEYFTQANKSFASLDNTEMVVETWLELGLAAEKQADFDKAIGFYEKAQGVAEKQNLQASLSRALLYQGNSHWFQGNYQNAFKFQKRALTIAKEMGDKKQQLFIHNTLGLIYWTLNDSPRALTDLNTSLDLAVEDDSTLDQASAYNNIGLVYRKDKDYPKSIEYFNKALAKDELLRSKWGQGYSHRNLGMSYLRMEKLAEAETHIKKAIELSAEIKNNTNLVKAKLELGNLALKRGRCQEAIPTFKETAKLADDFNIPEVKWRALQGQGMCLAKANRRPEAIESYKKAVAVVDSMRAAIKIEEFQNGFLTDKQDVYKELIILLLDDGKVAESFNYAERAKSRSFIDLLGNQKISLKDDVSQKMYDRLVEQKKIIRNVEESLAKAESDEDRERTATKLVESRNAYQDILIEAKEQNPEISSFVTVESITLKDLYTLVEDDVALVEYLVTKSELVAWVIVKNQIKVVRTPIVEADLKKLIDDYLLRMQKLAPLEDKAIELYGKIIKPVEALIKSKRVVGIIPHGLLHYLSFASLYDGESYLIEKHPLFYSPSASVLKFTFGRKQKIEGPVKVLALGNPDLGTVNYDLPLAEMEANAIRWNYPEVTVLTNENAKESWLQENIGKFQIIHIASHGEFDPINPLFSSLKLSKDEKADGNFEVNEVFSLDIKADLVTLSACQTGLGDIKGGDELVGLNRAFIYAGTHTIVSSLWRVSDISTAILIKLFYRNYSQENKGESLRKAQLSVKQLYPHPSYWAGFNLTGDYR
jgi:CHAT domain-containing protein/Flp pilus assembly protein TadD